MVAFWQRARCPRADGQRCSLQLNAERLGSRGKMTRSNWAYDEMRQVGVDFDDAEQVVQYDAKQGSDQQAHRLLSRSVACSNRATSIRDYIAGWCAKGDKFKDDCVRGRIGESVSCDVYGEDAVPDAYIVQPDPPPKRVDRKVAPEALKIG